MSFQTPARSVLQIKKPSSNVKWIKIDAELPLFVLNGYDSHE